MKTFARNVALVLITLAFVLLLWQFRSALVLFILSLVFAAMARPFVTFMTNRGIRRGLAIILTYLLAILIIVVLLVVVTPSLLSQLQQLSDQFVVFYRDLWEQWPQGTQLQRTIIRQLPPAEDIFNMLDAQGSTSLVAGFLTFTSGSATVIAQLFIALVLSIYWAVDRVRFERVWLSLLPAANRMRARVIWREVEDGLGSYMRFELMQSLVAGILLGIGLWWIGTPYSTLLAFIGAAAWLIPWFGFLLVIPLVALASLTVSPLVAVIASVYTLLVLLLLELIIEPRVVKRERDSPLLALLTVIALGSLIGVMGIIIAPPVAATIQLLARRMFVKPPPVLTKETIQQVIDLNRHLESINNRLADVPDEQSQPIRSILNRLEGLISRAKALVEQETERGRLPAEKGS